MSLHMCDVVGSLPIYDDTGIEYFTEAGALQKR
jgi:hypothetical protein